MTLGIRFRYLLLTLLLIPALLSGCGGSSDNEDIPYSVEVWNQHSIVFGNDGTVKSAGYNAYGQLGDGTREDRNLPVSVQGLGDERVAGFAAGATHTLAFTVSGKAFAWGFNSHGQLGNSGIDTSLDSRTEDYSAAAVAVESLTGVTSVAAGGFYSLAVAAGKVYSWGANTHLQLGYATDEVVNNAPREVPGLSSVIQVAAGGTHSVALGFDGRVWAWGDNEVNQLGPNAAGLAKSVAPVEVVFTALPVGVVPVEIAAGGSFTLARMSDGTVWAWGHNQYGQSGVSSDGSKLASVETPVLVTFPGARQATGIAAGIDHALALMSDGTVWAWGFNERGQLGNNPDLSEDAPSPDRYIPVQMLMGGTSQHDTGTPVTGVEKVQAFGNSSLATRRDSEGRIEVWGWGDNAFGQLGVERPENGIGFSVVPVKMRGI